MTAEDRHDVKRHIERAAHIAKAQSRLGSINRFVAAGCEIDKVTSAEIALAIFIAKHNLPMAVGNEFGLLAKKMWCTIVPITPPGGGKNTNYRFFTLFRPVCPRVYCVCRPTVKDLDLRYVYS